MNQDRRPNRPRRLIHPATVISLLALVLAAGGGAYASSTVGTPSVAGWAVVSATGHLVRGSGAVNAFILKKHGKAYAGDYQVTFTTRVSGCSYEASVGNTASGVPPLGDIGVATRGGNPNAVYVRTVNLKGFGADEAFHLEVLC